MACAVHRMTALHATAVEDSSLLRLMHSRWREVPVTVALVVINLVVFALMAFASSDVLHLAPGVSLNWGANFGPATQEGEWWRLFTAVFVHLSLIHVAVNLWALWDVGRLVERLLGRWRYAMLFVASGVFGNLASLALQDHQRVSSGASGAIFGLYGALIAFLWRERARIAPDEYRWISRVAIAFSALMLVVGLFIPSMDNAAHAGGLLAGMVLANLLGHAGIGVIEARRQRIFSLAGVLALVAVIAVSLSLSNPPYRYSDELATRAAISKFVTEDQRISARWQAVLESDGNASFDQLAGLVNRDVAEPYQRSFEALARVESNTNVPSRAVLLQMQSYAERRRTEALQNVRALQGASGAANKHPP
jgi:rhomboid protease GluP